jgi:hypothetical protein
MEDEMLRIRIFHAGAIAAVILAVGSAAAATNDQPGQPLALLAGLKPPHQTKAVHGKAADKTAVKVAARKIAKRHDAVAAKESTDTPQPANTSPDNSWPAPEQTAPENAAAAQPTPDATPATDAPALSEMIVDGQTVQIAAPDEINAIDLAADDQNATAPTPGDSADAAPAPAIAVAMREDASPVGSASWFAQVLAALGGAIAAGSVAWFLIGSGPQRMYG